MSTRKPRYVYIAAPMSGPPNEYLASCAQMSRYSRDLIEDGICPINPAADMIEGLMHSEPLSDRQYKERSMELLRLLAGRDDAEVHVLGYLHYNGEPSFGVENEVAEARRLGIAVVDAGTGWW